MKTTFKDGKLIIEIDCKTGLADPKSLPLSGSGKSRALATTNGNKPVDGMPPDVRLGLNLYVLVPVEERGK